MLPRVPGRYRADGATPPRGAPCPAQRADHAVHEVPAWGSSLRRPTADLLRFYREGERTHGVPWEVLAAINLVETGFGKIRGLSTAGAQGPMQFIPSTWAAYGKGDINDPHDSILAAARYLAANGGDAAAGIDCALYRYNNHPATSRASGVRLDPRARPPGASAACTGGRSSTCRRSATCGCRSATRDRTRAGAQYVAPAPRAPPGHRDQLGALVSRLASLAPQPAAACGGAAIVSQPRATMVGPWTSLPHSPTTSSRSTSLPRRSSARRATSTGSTGRRTCSS